MTKEILYEEKLTPVDYGKTMFYFERSNIIELSKDEVKQFKSTLEKNIETLNKMLADMDVEKKIKEEERKLNNDYKIQKEAYDNYEKYFADNLREMKKNKERDKLKIKQYIENFDKIKEHVLNKKRTVLEQQRNNVETQLNEDKKMFEVYSEY